MRLALLNGPNLNLLGVREPEIYGRTTLTEVEAQLGRVAASLGATLACVQRNGEGELIEAIHALRGQCDGAIINAGAYSHTSLAIRDAFAAVSVPFVEVHLTNVHAREPERRHSMLAAGAEAVLAGFGAHGYELALRGLVQLLRPAT